MQHRRPSETAARCACARKFLGYGVAVGFTDSELRRDETLEHVNIKGGWHEHGEASDG